MPSLESFKKEQTKRPVKAQPKKKAVKVSAKVQPKVEAKVEAKARPKRRPALEGATTLENGEKIAVVDMEEKMNAKTNAQSNSQSNTRTNTRTSADENLKDEDPKFQFAFPGSELLRARFPKSLSFTEVVVDEWAKDGNFENLPIEHPIVALMAQKGLRQAKETETKIFANPVVERALVQAITVGFKVQNAWVDAKKRWKKG